MSNKSCCFMDKETLREIGYELWKLRKQRGMYLKSVSVQTKLPERVIKEWKSANLSNIPLFAVLPNFTAKKCVSCLNKINN